MIIKLRPDVLFPHLKESNLVEVRAVANWSENGKKRSRFIDSQKDIDSLPKLCDSISVMFADGAYVEIPLNTFKTLFKIIPKGELTDAIYGDN